ncbi:MAG: hypothetical protein MUE74_00780, partial [Bacteroidales bacterium]|nr:hypothetical protein [Bacteroidales bacterium]
MRSEHGSLGFIRKKKKKKMEKPSSKLIVDQSAAQLFARADCILLKVPIFTGSQNPPRRCEKFDTFIIMSSVS